MDYLDLSRFPCRRIKYLDAECAPCEVLQQAGVRSVVWCEHAVCRYGARCVPYCLFILVDDLAMATAVLVSHGWRCAAGGNQMMNWVLKEDGRRLRPPASRSGELLDIQLLPASNWYYDLHDDAKSVYPTLPGLADALIGKILDPNSQYVVVICMQLYLFYLYDHVPDVKTLAFATHLRYEHQQFHRDCLSNVSVEKLIYLDHARQYRDDLLSGARSLCECSVPRTEVFFPHLSASWQAMISAPGYESYDDAARRIHEEELIEWQAMLEEEAKQQQKQQQQSQDTVLEESASNLEISGLS